MTDTEKVAINYRFSRIGPRSIIKTRLRVIVPPYPGITSAMGLLTTDLKYDTVRTVFARSDRLDSADSSAPRRTPSRALNI